MTMPAAYNKESIVVSCNKVNAKKRVYFKELLTHFLQAVFPVCSKAQS